MSCKPTYKGKRYNSLEELKSSVITPQQKQQAQQLYSQYVDAIKPDVILPIGTSGSGKSTFIKSLPQENLANINNEEKSLKLALKGLTPEEKISFSNHFGITMTEENGTKC